MRGWSRMLCAAGLIAVAPIVAAQAQARQVETPEVFRGLPYGHDLRTPAEESANGVRFIRGYFNLDLERWGTAVVFDFAAAPGRAGTLTIRRPAPVGEWPLPDGSVRLGPGPIPAPAVIPLNAGVADEVWTRAMDRVAAEDRARARLDEEISGHFMPGPCGRAGSIPIAGADPSPNGFGCMVRLRAGDQRSNCFGHAAAVVIPAQDGRLAGPPWVHDRIGCRDEDWALDILDQLQAIARANLPGCGQVAGVTDHRKDYRGIVACLPEAGR